MDFQSRDVVTCIARVAPRVAFHMRLVCRVWADTVRDQALEEWLRALSK